MTDYESLRVTIAVPYFWPEPNNTMLQYTAKYTQKGVKTSFSLSEDQGLEFGKVISKPVMLH